MSGKTVRKDGRRKRVIATPCAPVAKAGARPLEFSSMMECCAYFGMEPSSLSRHLHLGHYRLPTCGYYFDLALDAGDGGLEP